MGKVAIFVTGEKGGVGKSLLSRVFAECLRDAQNDPRSPMHGKSVGILDADGKNLSLTKYFGKSGANDPLGGVGWFDLDSESEADNVLDAVSLNADVLLFDVPGGGATKLASAAGTPSGLLSAFQKAGYDVAFVLVFTPFHDAVATCKITTDFYGAAPGARYYAVKNHPRDEDLSASNKGRMDWIYYEPGLQDSEPLFDGMTGREVVEKHAGKTFELRALAMRHLMMLNAHGVGFREAVIDDDGPLQGQVALRMKVSNWLELAEKPLGAILRDSGVIQ